MALSGDRATKKATSATRSFTVASGVTIYAGAMVSVDTSGTARPSRTSTTDICVGVACHRATAGTKVKVETGVIAYFGNSSASDEIAVDDIGKDCYLVDDETVALTNGSNTRVRAGKVHNVTSDGVAVRFDQ